MANLTDEKVKEMAARLLELDAAFISLGNIAPAVERDVQIDGGLKDGVAWDVILSALAAWGQEQVGKVLEALPTDA